MVHAARAASWHDWSRPRVSRSVLVASAVMVLFGCGGTDDGAEPVDPVEDVTDDGTDTEVEPEPDATTDAPPTDDAPTDDDDATGDGEPAMSAAGAVEQAATSRDRTWQVTYRTGDTEVVVANRDPRLVATVDGEVVVRVTPDGPQSCVDGDCQLLLMDAGAPLSQVLGEQLGPAAVGLDVGEIAAIDPAIDPTAATIADRAATCVVVPVGAIGPTGDGLTGDEDVEVCVDDDTGAVLRSSLGDDTIEATALTTSVDDALFDG